MVAVVEELGQQVVLGVLGFGVLAHRMVLTWAEFESLAGRFDGLGFDSLSLGRQPEGDLLVHLDEHDFLPLHGFEPRNLGNLAVSRTLFLDR